MPTKYSCKRESLRELLSSRYDHPTAEAIYFSLKEIHPNISLATVYRNLNLLVAEGDVIKLTGNDSADHFDGNSKPHYHFYCNNCGSIIDIDTPVFTSIDKIAGESTGVKVNGHAIMFYGICSDCMKN